MPGPGLHLCQQCQLGALPSHISHSALAGMCLQSPHPPEHRALSFLPFPDNKEFLKAPELPRGRLAPCHGVATGHRRSQGQPHIPVPSSTGMRAVTHVPHWLLLPLASPSQGSSCSHAPCSEQGTAEAQPCSCRGSLHITHKLLVLVQDCCNTAMPPCRSFFAKKSFTACLCLSTPNSFGKMWSLLAKFLKNAYLNA